jgi:hypothetical protein
MLLDSMMRVFDDDTKDRIARGCIEELISCERRKSEIAAKQDKNRHLKCPRDI